MVLVAWALVLLFAGVELRNLKIDTTIGSALDKAGEPWADYQRSLTLFGGDEFVSIALAPSEEPFSKRSLKTVLALSDELEQLGSVRRVDSLSTVALIRSEADGSLLVSPALTDEAVTSAHARSKLAEQVRRDRIAYRSLVSEDGRVFGVNVVFDEDVDGDRESTVSEIAAVLSYFDGAVMSGVPVVRAEAGLLTRSEIVRLVPGTVVAIAIILALSFGRARATIPALAVGGIGTATCLAAMAAAGTPLSFSTAVLPSVILALACAYAMHFLTAESRSIGRADTALELKAVAGPVALSGCTTALGFISMGTTNVSLIRDLAVFGALGVFVSTVACLTIVPALLSMLPATGERTPRILGALEMRIGPAWTEAVLRRRKPILFCWLAALLACVVGLSRLQVSSDVIEWFPPGGELRASYAQVTDRLSGITPVNVVVSPPAGSSAVSPEMVRRLAAFSAAAESHPAVGKSLSIADPLAMMHREIGDGDGLSLPSEASLISQYLALLDGVEQLDDVVTPTRDAANVLLRLNENSSEDIRAVEEWVRRWWVLHGVPGSKVDVTGIMYEFARAQDSIAWAGLRGAALAFVTIALLVAAYFRDARFLLAAVVINAVPVAVIMGVIGWLRVPLDAATVCVASLAVGIAVDDTIHALAEIRSASEPGKAFEKSVMVALPRVMTPLVLSTLAIGAGFGVLATSSIALISGLGLAMCAAVAACLLADLSLLPSLLAGRSQPMRK